MKKIAIIVTYYPKKAELNKLITRLSYSGTFALIIDNTDNNSQLEIKEKDNSEIIHLNKNVGIAKAQNIGIDFCKIYNPDIVIFLDQDSEIDKYFVEKLILPLKKYDVVCPKIIDKEHGFVYYPIKLNRFGYPRKIKSINDHQYIKIDYSISSGTAINYNVLLKTKLFKEHYFIDYVDTEWFLRIKKMGISTVYNQNAKLYHKIGNRSINLKLLNIQTHNPIRTYYKTRNCFLISKERYVPTLFKIKEITTSLISNILIIVFDKINRKDHLKYFIKGIQKGLISK